MAGKGDPKKVVLAALAANGGIMVVKFISAWLSGSATMLAEGVHSAADTANQALLLVGMTLAVRQNPSLYPLGREAERYFWAFIVSITLFFLGGVFAVFEGVHKLTAPDEGHGGSLLVPLIVLVVSFVLEIGSFTVAVREFNAERRGRPLFSALFSAKDPTIPVVLLEDTGAVLGLLIAIVALGVTALTGSAVPDGVGSLVIGILLCVIGVLLAIDTHGLLVGESASPELQERALKEARSTPGVEAVTQLLTLQLGPGSVLAARKVKFRSGSTLAEVEACVNELETRVRATCPEMKRIFVEPDSGYDESKDPARMSLHSPGAPSD
jgi:cation diffusion facilitator family transporter